jgi:biopolymer transport protein ExbB/TolQ
MEFGALLKSATYLISSSLLYPAMAVLLGSFAALTVACGAFLAEWAERGRLKEPGPDDWPELLKGRKAPNPYLNETLDQLQALLSGPAPSWAAAENLWQTARHRLRRRLDYLRILVRVGPSMGLIGTLIPMSTGLASLSQGDMSRLSADLVVAFTTTVLGLAVGVTAFVLYTVRSRWLERDLEVLRLIMESRAAEIEEKP